MLKHLEKVEIDAYREEKMDLGARSPAIPALITPEPYQGWKDSGKYERKQDQNRETR
jgi:hypothetical protein